MTNHKMTTESPRIQQDDNYREFLDWLTDGGLRYALARYMGEEYPSRFYRQKVSRDKRRDIIIVGAGVGGLSAAYELAQVGHNVTILEAQETVGGRVYTIRDGLTDGQFGEGGAMRIPHNHFLTRHYVDKFRIKTEPFQYYNDQGYLYVKGDKVRLKDWKLRNGYYTSKWWPGWDSNLTPAVKERLNIDGILDLLKATIAPLRAELGDSPTEEMWHHWIHKWGKMSFEDFLLSDCHQDPDGPQLRPWTKEAVEAYAVTTYSPMQYFSVVAYMRNEFGKWWSDPMTKMSEGMDSLPKAFARKNIHGWNKDVDLLKNISFRTKVDKVRQRPDGKIEVEAVKSGTQKRVCFHGDAVFLTLPLQILRQLNIELPAEKKNAMSRILIDSATKVILQCRSRFWEKDVGKGGFTKTDLPIGHFVYPGWNDGKQNGSNERGIILVYNRYKQAEMFQMKEAETAVADALDQISKIHTEIKDEFEVGTVHSWKSVPFAQGAFAAFYPQDYMQSMETLALPSGNIYIASDTLSWAQSCCSWIQGAIFSGLMQAFCFTYSLETSKSLNPVHLLYKPAEQENTENTNTAVIIPAMIQSRL